MAQLFADVDAAFTGPLKYELHPELMAQPPWDLSLTLDGILINIIHYTYGQDCRETDGQPLTDKVNVPLSTYT